MDSNEKSVCVIGAGIGGLGFAYYLGELGFSNVTLLEASSRVGGKCFTVFSGNRYYDMGAIEVTSEYPFTLKFIERFQLTKTATPPLMVFDRETGNSVPFSRTIYTEAELQELPRQLGNYERATTEEEIASYAAKPGLDGAPVFVADKSIAQFLDAIGAPGLKPLFWFLITCYGYGYIEDVPAAYGLKMASVAGLAIAIQRLGLKDHVSRQESPRLWESVLTAESFILQNGMAGLATEIARRIQTDFGHTIVTNAVVTSFDPSTGAVAYTAKAPPKSVTQKFDILVVAIPQTSGNLASLQWHAGPPALFQQVMVNNYSSTLLHVEGVPYEQGVALLANGVLGPPAAPAVMQFARPWNDDPSHQLALFWTYGDREAPLPLTRKEGSPSVEGLVTANAGVIPGTKQTGDIQSYAWQYFPQVDVASFQAGFYDRLEGLQGDNATYYVGGLLNFELVEKVLQNAYDRAHKIAGRS
jgi:Flavin containing amine oxidoreductase